MKTSLDATGEARRRLLQAAAAAAVVPQTVLAAVPAPAQLSTPTGAAWLDLRSAGPLRVSGRVVDAAGVALAGRRVTLIDDGGRVALVERCDADGRFLLAAAAVAGRFRVDLEGGRGAQAGVATTLTDAEGTTRCAVELRAGPD